MARITITIIDLVYCRSCGIRWKNLRATDGHVFCPICEVELCTS